MDYLSYEETVPLLQRSYFGDFRFIKRDEVVKVIEDLSDEQKRKENDNKGSR